MLKHQLCKFLSFRSCVPLQIQKQIIYHIIVSTNQTNMFLHVMMRISTGNKLISRWILKAFSHLSIWFSVQSQNKQSVFFTDWLQLRKVQTHRCFWHEHWMQAWFRLEMHLVGLIQNGLETIPVLNYKKKGGKREKSRAGYVSHYWSFTIIQKTTEDKHMIVL